MAPAISVHKVSVCPMKSAYAISTARIDGRVQVVAATEDHGPAVLIDPASWSARELLPGPGGCMSIAQLPERPGTDAAIRGQAVGEESMFAIFGCFPGYKFQGAGVYRIHRSSVATPFTATEIFKLPFAHRICFVEKDGTEYLIAANLAANKASPTDWTLAGSLFAARVPEKLSARWEPVPIFENLHKNHCMFSGTVDGRRVLLIGGEEGLYSFDLEAEGSGWSMKKIIDHEVSEAVLYDIDDDGNDELITIEPFHGNRLIVYRRIGAAGGGSSGSVLDAATLKPTFDAELSYGHGLWAGRIAGTPALLVGNRSGSRNLDVLTIRADGSGLDRLVVDAGAGSANNVVLDQDGSTWIVTTNQASEEVTAYRIDALSR